MQDTGVFIQKSQARSAQEQMMTNPDMMSNMLKQSVGGFVPQACPRLCPANAESVAADMVA